MATEYYQIPSSQGMMSLDASSSSFSSSTSSLSSSLALPANAFTPLSNTSTMNSSDPWLGNAVRNLSIDDWAPSTKRSPPSLFDADDIESRSWENIVPQQTPEVLKASFELKNSYEIKNPQKVPTKSFISTSAKIDAWSVVDPSVTVATKSKKPMNPLNMSLTMSQQMMHNAAGLQNSQGLMDSEDGSDRYKTELCKSFTETGVCRYGVKCQFAHGKEELRSVLRHPKYKTEICKTFHHTGTCPYGMRCRFIHTRTKDENSIFSASTSMLPDPELIEELDDNVEIVSKMAPPPGIPVPQWSKSWFSSSTGALTKKQVTTRKAF